MQSCFDVKSFGAVGDGYHDDTSAIQFAFDSAIIAQVAAVYFPPGQYLILKEIGFPTTTARITVFGAGSNVSVIYAQSCAGLNLNFAQNGAQQPYGAVIRDLGLKALGVCGTAIRISYGVPPISNDHNRPSVTITNVQAVSDPEGQWANGVELEGCWNPTLDNVFLSGDSCGGNWNAMHGAGIVLRGMCVNAHFANVRCNFWAVGLQAHSSDNQNTEGIFCSNCSMVAVKKGVWLKGDQLVPNAPRISTFTWVGGLIECRVAGVKDISAGIYLDAVWTGLISSTQILSEHIPPTDKSKFSYGILVASSNGVVVTGCDLNAWNFGVHTAGECRAVNVTGCIFTNVEKQVIFASGCEDSRSYGHTLVNNPAFEWSDSPTNKIGFI